MADVKPREWPLAVFTVLLQLSCGLALAAYMADQGVSSAQTRPLAIAVFPVVLLGGAFSLLHVGRPWSARRFLSNAARSRLSQEILLTGLFAVVALIYSLAGLLGGPRPAVGAAVAVFGLLAVAASARVYMVPSQPFWNAVWLPVSFAGTTLLLGGCGGLLVRSEMPGLFADTMITGGVLSVMSTLWMAARLASLRGCVSSSPQLDAEPQGLGSRHWLAFGAHVLLAAAVPLAVALELRFAAGGPVPSIAFSWATFGCVLLGAFLGRMLMFSLPASLPRF
jgi:DMSO reductase anchor subunit